MYVCSVHIRVYFIPTVFIYIQHRAYTIHQQKTYVRVGLGIKVATIERYTHTHTLNRK